MEKRSSKLFKQRYPSIIIAVLLCTLSLILIFYWLCIPYKKTIKIKDMYWTSTIEICKIGQYDKDVLYRHVFCNGGKETFPHYGSLSIDNSIETEKRRYINYYILDTNDRSYKCSAETYFNYDIGEEITYTGIRIYNSVVFDKY